MDLEEIQEVSTIYVIFFSPLNKHTFKKKFNVDLKCIRANKHRWNVNYKSKLNKKTLTPYKDKHKGKKCVLLGTGNTLNDYIPIKDAVHLGVNSIIYYEKLVVDYYFVMDNSGDATLTTFKKNEKEIYAYKPNIQKFFGRFRLLPKKSDSK